MYPQWDVNEFPAHSSNRRDQLNCAIECEQKPLCLLLFFDLTMWIWWCHRTETNDTWISQLPSGWWRQHTHCIWLFVTLCQNPIWKSFEILSKRYFTISMSAYVLHINASIQCDSILISFKYSSSMLFLPAQFANQMNNKRNVKEKKKKKNVSESCHHSICSSIDVSSLRIYMYFCKRDGEFRKPEKNLQRTFLYVHVAGGQR